MTGHREPWYLDRLRAELERAAEAEDRRERRGALGRVRFPIKPVLAIAAIVAAVVLAIAALYVGEAERGAVPAPGDKVVLTEGDIQFSLDRRLLTVRLLPGPSQILRRVSGARISATCGTNVAAAPGEPRREITLTRLWPAGQTSLSYRFPRDVSRWCQLEDQPGSIVAFVWFRGASLGARELITEIASNWARLFASSPQIPFGYMAQPVVEQMNCELVGAPSPILMNCTWPSRAHRLSFRDATVREVAIKGDRAAARFSNGETIELQKVSDSEWWVDKIGENAGRGFFK
jgi:hypothetical protein